MSIVLCETVECVVLKCNHFVQLYQLVQLHLQG